MASAAGLRAAVAIYDALASRQLYRPFGMQADLRAKLEMAKTEASNAATRAATAERNMAVAVQEAGTAMGRSRSLQVQYRILWLVSL